LGTPLRSGRTFTFADREGSTRVAIVNETMARLLWPGQNALGKCLHVGARNEPCSDVVGVVADVHRHGVREAAAMQYYVPLGQEKGFGGSGLLVRPRGQSAIVAAELQHALGAMPGVTFARVQPLLQLVDPEFRPWRLGATMFGVFGFVALVVAAIGLYSVIAYVIAGQTRELGVRMALGATSARIVLQIVASGVRMTAIGIGLGIVAVLLAGRFIEPLLFEVSARNPIVLGGVGGVLLLVSVLAALASSVRATRIDPVIALRAD
jgi:hypothetical protein